MEYYYSIMERKNGTKARLARLRDDSREVALTAKSPAMCKVMDLARRMAVVDSTVLITGESGTGKEWIARVIHSLSARARGPFVAINCGALPEELLESELFGHVKGAFTGAIVDKQGLFEVARRGILFLDEIGETPPQLQVKLLRVLQDHCIRRVGGTKEIKVDTRVIAATNRDLEEMIEAKQFRNDLYYRLKVLALEVPPLRARKADILPLAHHFIEKACKSYDCGPCALSAEALDLLLSYPWPGNIRELENSIERAVVLAKGKPKIVREDLPPEIQTQTSVWPVRAETDVLPLAEMEREYILRVLEKFGGNRTRAAKALDIGLNTLWRKLRAYGVIQSGDRSGKTNNANK